MGNTSSTISYPKAKPHEEEYSAMATTGKDAHTQSLLTEAEAFYVEDKMYQTAKILRSLDQNLLEEKHHAMLRYVLQGICVPF